MITKAALEIALYQYLAGHTEVAKNILTNMTRRIPITDDNIDDMAYQAQSNPKLAAEAWIDLALDTIESEQGKEIWCPIPVPLAIECAISLAD